MPSDNVCRRGKMICILLVAGHQKVLDDEIKSSEKFSQYHGVPKALLPGPGGKKKILDHWWDILKNRQLFSDVYLVCNADKFKYFERWASAVDFPLSNIINDGTTTFDSRLGTIGDVELCLKMHFESRFRDEVVEDAEDFLIVSGEIMFQDSQFDLGFVTRHFKAKKDEADLALYFNREVETDISELGVLDVCPETKRVLQFIEKPKRPEDLSQFRGVNNISVVFYCFRSMARGHFRKYVEVVGGDKEELSFGKFMEWYVNDQRQTVYGLKLPTGFRLIGQTKLKDYENWVQHFARIQEIESAKKSEVIVKRANARVGIMGNPSDGFNGKTISLSIKNFWAEVTIVESQHLLLVPNPLCDPTEFGGLQDLHDIYMREGYLGGLRLLQATCKKFYRLCCEKGIALTRRKFTLKYDTNIPRQVGLAGSSAIVTATLKCLMEFYNVTDEDFKKEMQPQFILDVEKDELFINAGLQDRVVQVYGGLMYMDFSEDIMRKEGHGNYVRLDAKEVDLPNFFLAYLSDPSDSGKIHNHVRALFDGGDERVVDCMRKLAAITDEAKDIFESGSKDWDSLAKLMNQNFELRRSIYGEECLGQGNLRMIEIGRKYGAGCKFPGNLRRHYFL